jgi:hypothetical protein
VRLYVPAAPTFLAREWVNVAWKQLTAARRWGFLRGELVLTITASRAIASCVVTEGSATVASAGLFVAGDVGRQFQVATYPTYTIQTVTDVNTIVLDRVYGEPTAAAATALVFDAYATLPADFGSFRIIADPYNQRRLAFWITEDQLNLLDPTRMAGDNGPRLLAARSPSTYAPTLGRAQYEYWPRPTAARSYPARYNRQADNLNDTDVFTGVLADGAQVLIAGALAQAAQWPGTGDRPNPYFNATIATAKQLEFRQGIQSLSLRDDDQYPDDLATVHWERWPLADLAYNDRALRATDATVAELY